MRASRGHLTHGKTTGGAYEEPREAAHGTYGEGLLHIGVDKAKAGGVSDPTDRPLARSLALMIGPTHMARFQPGARAQAPAGTGRVEEKEGRRKGKKTKRKETRGEKKDAVGSGTSTPRLGKRQATAMSGIVDIICVDRGAKLVGRRCLSLPLVAGEIDADELIGLCDWEGLAGAGSSTLYSVHPCLCVAYDEMCCEYVGNRALVLHEVDTVSEPTPWISSMYVHLV